MITLRRARSEPAAHLGTIEKTGCTVDVQPVFGFRDATRSRTLQ